MNFSEPPYMKFDQVHDNRNIMLLQCVSGSRAYGLETPTSDTDIRGVFCLPLREYYGLDYTPQVANESNDIAYYEVKRYIDLLVKNNPNILELLSTPADCIIFRHRVLDLVRPEIFLSKLCLETFAGYALTQVKKAGGLNKKVFNPIDKKRKTLIDFCYYIEGYATIPIHDWLSEHEYRQEDCGLVKIAHARDIYAIFHNNQPQGVRMSGIISGENANDVSLSSVPAGTVPLGIISCNKDGYSAYCKDYKEYWEWVEKRNDTRYNNTLEHGKNYDAKNIMHTFRLLNMAGEIAREGRVNVRRHDREFLLQIRRGDFTYEELMERINEQMDAIRAQFAKSNLPDMPDVVKANEVLAAIRAELYW